MRIDPAIEAWRHDRAAQDRAQRDLEAARQLWREGAARGVLADLERYGSGAELNGCPQLAASLACPAAARALVAPLMDGMASALREHPLGQVPFRHHRSAGSGLIQLAQHGRAALSLAFYDAESGATPATTTVFSDGERHEICLAGEGEGRLLSLTERDGEAAISAIPLRLREGVALALGSALTKRVDRVAGRLVMLRLGREALAPGPSREFRIEDGALVHRASGDGQESRDEIAIALLARMGRGDAAPVLAAIAEGEGSAHLRWQALRAALALDTASGFAALERIARDAADDLSESAAALHARLLAAHPQLARVTRAPCPA